MAAKKKRKKDPLNVGLPSDSDTDFDEEEKFKPFQVKQYNRKYQENSNKTEFVVFLSHKKFDTAFSDNDRLAISQGIRKHGVSGVAHLRPVNRFKIAITFNICNNANVFLQNRKFLDELDLVASIPAGDCEVTGVLTMVPQSMSNKKVYQLIGSTKNVVQVRRFMRKLRAPDGSISFAPTQTVAVTFAATQLPEYVLLDAWRHEVKPYVPPVKQCLRCMRFGHIAKFCKNAEVCSICSGNHNYKNCITDSEHVKCANCSGNHVAISTTCPMKKTKIEENKIKTRSVKYSDLFNEQQFPNLSNKTISSQLLNLSKSDTFINYIVEAILKITSNKENTPINNKSIKEVLLNTIKTKSNLPLHNG